MNKLLKNSVLALITIVFIFFGILKLYPEKLSHFLLEKIIDDNINRPNLKENKTQIVVYTIGTGSPANAERANSGTAVFVNGKFFIFDVGDGVVKKSENMNLPIQDLDGIFITHYHSDHFIDLPYLINRSWVMGRNHDLNVYGPEGLDEIMQSSIPFLKLENKNRVDHHGAEVMNTNYAFGISNEFQDEPKQIIYNQDGVVITAFNVDHKPIKPAVGYSIEYNEKKVVISGDTKKSEMVLEISKNADLLIHEVILSSLLKTTVDILDLKSMTRNSKIITDIQNYHTTPKEVIELANKANVKKLILTHLVPNPDNLIIKNLYKKEMKGFKGEIHLANDGDKFIVK